MQWVKLKTHSNTSGLITWVLAVAEPAGTDVMGLVVIVGVEVAGPGYNC